MRHPLLGKSFLYYALAWAATIAAHTFILYWQLGFDKYLALGDGLVFYLPLMGFGIVYWYVVQYITPENQGTSIVVVNQVIAITIGVGILGYTSNAVLTQLKSDDTYYLSFLNTMLPWRIFIGVFFMGMIVLIYYLLQYTHSLKEKEKDELQLQNLLKNAELEMLKSQLNPHFIFNSLNSVSALTLTKPEMAHEMVIKLSDFLRLTLGRTNQELHSLAEELKQMNLYLDIERIRFGDRLTIEQEIDEICLKHQVPVMIMQPLYENAIKYAVYEQLDKVVIKTVCYCDQKFLNIAISNNYDSTASPQKGRGIGLKNVRNRLDLIYGISDLVTIEKNLDTFTIRLQIPQPIAP